MTSSECSWDQFALLLVDVQQDFWPERLAEHFPDFPDNVSRLLETCRSQGLEVVHLRASFQPDMSDWMPRYRLRGRIPCIAGTEGVAVLPFAHEEPGEKVILKQTFGGFHNPELGRYLHDRRKRFLLVAGLVTSTCVLFTASSATQLGFLCAVVEDCCADEPVAHQQTLDRYRFIFDLAPSDRLVDLHSDWSEQLASLLPEG